IATSVTTRSKGPAAASSSTSSAPVAARVTRAPRPVRASATASSNSGSSSATRMRASDSTLFVEARNRPRTLCGGAPESTTLGSALHRNTVIAQGTLLAHSPHKMDVTQDAGQARVTWPLHTSTIAGVFSVVLGATVLAGMWLHVWPLVRPLPNLPA